MFRCPEETLRKIQHRVFSLLDTLKSQYITLDEAENLPYGTVVGGEIKTYQSHARKIIKTCA